MIKSTRSCRIAAGCFLLSNLLACASGPDKPDPLTALAAEDEQPVDATASDAERSGDGTIPFEKGMNRPGQIAGPSPSLPPQAIAEHVTGTWIARCVITETGSVEGCKIVKGLRLSDAHLLQIIQAQKYSPVVFEGKPQRVFYTFKITFR